MQILNIHGVDDVRLDPARAAAPGPGDVVIKVKACGICGSDLTYIKHGGIHRAEGGVTPLGHEAAGEVMAVGDDVEGVAIGQRFVINPMRTPSLIGTGGPEGAFTEQLLVRAAKVGDSLLPIPDDLPFDVAALTEPLAVSLHGVNRAEAKAGEKVAVFGCGPIGLGMILWLIDRGVTDVVALDLADERLERALALGVSGVINPARDDVRARLLELHGPGRTLNRDAVGTDAYIDAAGAPNILGDVIAMGKMHARYVCTAAYSRPVELDLGRLLTSEMTITSAVGYPDEMPEVLAALPRLADKAATLISHRFALSDAIEALRVAATSRSAKVMIEMPDPVA
ncbi:zinc-binding dehydrogenase [Sphingobium sp. C100]|uniref:zinc-dependent alcohol dehydrogenase n=1 Tax=Sphingobium sp. C100 TaxID=1207055 RepID=UPI0003D65B7D|nr:alcohol dehydrogenase catalytic domain-containing protein [Sphingobium sp. C100]ETI64241.1 zinc-binding dehydrogenase [Sphingobium sp. C100]